MELAWCGGLCLHALGSLTDPATKPLAASLSGKPLPPIGNPMQVLIYKQQKRVSDVWSISEHQRLGSCFIWQSIDLSDLHWGPSCGVHCSNHKINSTELESPERRGLLQGYGGNSQIAPDLGGKVKQTMTFHRFAYHLYCHVENATD